jgi:chromosome partitioning protein
MHNKEKTMSAPVLTFFNNKGGVGKTSLVYHLAHMFAEMRKRVIAVDLDPQANLTAAFLSEDELEYLWENNEPAATIFRSISPLSGVGDILHPILKKIQQDLYLIPGDVALSGFEEIMAGEWPNSMGDSNLYRPFRILTSFWQVMQMAAQKVEADLILVDVGPHLGAINRSVLIATDHVIIPLGADLFSIVGLKNLGPVLRNWRSLWKKRLENWKSPDFELPRGLMQPAGYICQQHSVRLSRPVKAYDKWINRIPDVYRECVLQEPMQGLTPSTDPLCLATIKHYRSLVPMAHEARKPVFSLSPADGAIGNHASAVKDAYDDFRKLSRKIAIATRIQLPKTYD